jgi:hypothetical protein
MLLVCLLAVIGFSSCNNEDYTDLYTGYYDVKVTQNLKVIAPIYGEIPLQEENIYGTAQIVKDENEGDSNVKILMSFRQGGIYYLDAYCDQTCMRIENKKVNINPDYNYTKRGANELELNTSIEEKVGFIKSFPGISEEFIEYHIDKGYKGLVIETPVSYP